VSEDPEVATLLQQLIEVSQKGYEDLKREISDLRSEMRQITKEHADRIGNLERFMFTVQGGLVVSRTLAGASLLGAVLAISVSLSQG
jgi:hypothetical protein